MTKPYIDKSIESNQEQYSIHSLSKAEIIFILNGLKISNWHLQCSKIACDPVIKSDEKDKILKSYFDAADIHSKKLIETLKNHLIQ